jgi:hypothetical protein
MLFIKRLFSAAVVLLCGNPAVMLQYYAICAPEHIDYLRIFSE